MARKYEEMEFDPESWIAYLHQHGFEMAAQSGKDYAERMLILEVAVGHAGLKRVVRQPS